MSFKTIDEEIRYVFNLIIENFNKTGKGSAIFNDGGTITNITGNFISNHSDGNQNHGGAIHNAGTIESITGNFESNYVKEMIVDSYKELVEKNVNPHDKRGMTFILSRIQYLCEKKPIQICSGLGGFSGYFVYIFEKNTIVVDSCKYGNATYILNDDWQSVSKRTKKEILDAQLHKQRIIHSTKWQKEISKLF